MQAFDIMESTGRLKEAVKAAQRSISEREREILLLVAQGFSNAEIGECLSITRLTVRTHLENIFAKLNVRDRTQAVVRYFFFAESEKVIGNAYSKWRSDRSMNSSRYMAAAGLSCVAEASSTPRSIRRQRIPRSL